MELPKGLASRIAFEPMSGCWLWIGALEKKGYGKVAATVTDPRWRKAHRVVYELAKGPIPVGLELDHLCRVHCCVNPDHLEAVTHRENLMRGRGFYAQNARKTHCVWGHPLSGDNLQFGKGWRSCVICYAERSAGRRTVERHANGC